MKKLVIIIFSILISVCVNAQYLSNLEPKIIATGLEFTEGPAWHPDGYLVFSDISANKIYKWSEQTGLQILTDNAGNSNGIACTKSNDFFVCRHGLRDIAKMTEDGNLTSYISEYSGKKLNSPNDVTISYTGSIYFTDPDYGVEQSERELDFHGLYCIPQNTNEIILLDNTLNKPNGLTFANDWRTLYVCESSTNNIYSYFLRDEYVIQDMEKDKKLFVQLEGNGEIDGITSDVFGNIYVAYGNGGIKIFNTDATEIGNIDFPAGEKVRNLCFGGKYMNILFVTAGTSLYKIEIRFNGDFIASGLLGVPTDNSIIFNALSDKSMSCYIAFGTNPNDLSFQTQSADFKADMPIEINIVGLLANTQYYYQLMYHLEGENEYKKGTSGSFFTQRKKGEVFSFAVEADPHLDESSNYQTFRNMLKNVKNLSPDFMIDLGDNFMVEKFPLLNRYYMEQRCLLYRHFWDNTCNSVPLFIAQGNHDAELRWLSNNTADDPFNTATTVRKMYYPTPFPDGFYTGNTENEIFVGQRENYYAWNWGDALFVVIDPYGYIEDRTKDPWCFTLGKQQYDWFRQTLEGSNARYKFVFAHQLVGGDELGRGGAEYVNYYEMGGNNEDGTYGFDENRPGWGKPLHQIMVENGVQIYFHGHDHFYAEQPKDGIVYQECPQPSFPGYNVVNDAETYGYVSGIILPNSGHLQITVLGDSAKVDYIEAYHVENEKKNQVNGNIRRTYYVNANDLQTTGVSEISNCKPLMFQQGEFIVIESKETASGNVQVYSLTGQLLHTVFTGEIMEGKNYYSLPSGLVPQIYIVAITTDKFYISAKIVKQ